MKKRNALSVRRATESAPARSGVGALLFGLLLFLGTGALLLCVGVLILLRLSDPDPYFRPIALVALFLASCIGGFAAAKRNGGGILPMGLLSGAAQALTTIFLALLLPSARAGLTSPLSWGLRCVLLPCATLGAFLALQLSAPPKRRHHRS